MQNEDDGDSPPQSSDWKATLRREYPWMIAALLVIAGALIVAEVVGRRQSAELGVWLHAQLEGIRRGPAAAAGGAGASADAEWQAGYRAVAASRSETLPASFELDSRDKHMLACVNLVLHGAKDQPLAVIISDIKGDRELVALSTTRECFCDPDLIARCSLR